MMEINLLNKKYHGLLFSINKYWKGVYIHMPYKKMTLTIRIFLFGIDWRWSR